jgi:thioredoxin reductase (NADPH)
MGKDEQTASNDVHDLVIVGAGPAGLIAAYTAAECGLSYLVLERGCIAQTVHEYPFSKPLHSPACDVEFRWGELFSRNPTPSREEVLAYYNRFCTQLNHLNVRTREPVTRLECSQAGFVLHTPGGCYRARHVLLATGGFGIPRRLGVPGDRSDHVQYRFVEGYPYAGQEVLVVGGGNSAGECTLYLHEASARVTLSLRRPSFAPRGGESDAYTSVKPWVREPLEALAARGEIRILYSSHVLEIRKDDALVQVDGQHEPLVVPCAQVFALLGADPDVSLLRQIGAEIATDGRPVYDAKTYETTVPGCYVAGHLTRELHMKNAIVITPRIVRALARRGDPKSPPAWSERLLKALNTARFRSLFARRVLKRLPGLRGLVQSMS